MSTSPVIGIAGFGVEGKATYEYFKGKADIHVFDDAPVKSESIEATFHQGLHIPKSIEVVYKSPGIPTSKLSLESDMTLIRTLIDTALEKVRDRTIGVTGTKGKSTVASLIHHVLTESGRKSLLYGNIGFADMWAIEEDSSERMYVMELSSYQLEHVAHSPHVAVLLNLYPEHLDHHGSLEAYRDAKLNIARFQKSGDVFVNGSSLQTSFKGSLIKPEVGVRFVTKLSGEHNQRNCAAAFTALKAVGVSEEVAREHIATFEPLEYRLQTVGTYRGITFVDDSLATVPEATIAALASLPRVDTLIVGGSDRGIPFDTLSYALSVSSVNTFITFPETGAKAVAKVQDRKVIPVSTMEEAVTAAYENTPLGGLVLLSNASPSFNMFKDYKDKSAQYRSWIGKLGA